MSKNTGGPAFPVGTGYQGMSMRDYFAAQVVTSFVDFGTLSEDEYFHQAAQAAYKLADAMLKAREKS